MTYEPKPITRILEVPEDVAPPADGAESLRLTVRVSLSPAEMRRINASGRSIGKRCDAIAPFILGWNFGDYPPPATAGAAQLAELPIEVADWVQDAVISMMAAAAQEKLASALAARRAEAAHAVPNAATPAA